MASPEKPRADGPAPAVDGVRPELLLPAEAAAAPAAAAAAAKPSPWLVHGAMVFTMMAFGGASVVGKFGVKGGNPCLFALVREVVAGLLLLALALARYGRAGVPQRRHLPRLLACGASIFGSQFLVTIGLKLNDPVIMSAWQPSQPIFTLILAVLVGYERLTARRLLGVLLAVAGALFLVLFGAHTEGGKSGVAGVASQGFFFFNALCMSLYVILTKPLYSDYPPLVVTAWSYVFGMVCITAAVLVVNCTPPLLAFVCASPDAGLRRSCIDGAWRVPKEMLWPLAYWILLASVVTYILLTWTNKYARASIVSAYTVLQPVTAGLVSSLLIFIYGREWGAAQGLQYPGVQDLGVVGIVLGLAVLVSEPALPGEPPLPGDGEAAEACEDLEAWSPQLLAEPLTGKSDMSETSTTPACSHVAVVEVATPLACAGR